MKMKKILATLLAAGMLLSMASCSPSAASSGASSQTGAASGTESKTDKTVRGNITFPLSDTKEELSVWTEQLSNVVSDFDTNQMTKWYEDLTNVHIKWTAVPTADKQTQLNLSLSSDAHPDIYGGDFGTTEVQLYGGKVFLALNDLMDKGYLPNTKEWMDSTEALQQLYAPDGNLYGFPCVQLEYHMRSQNKLFINSEWLKKLNMEKPTTTEEFKQMLIAFRDNDMNGNGDTTDEVPLSGSQNSWAADPIPFLMSAFILPGSSYTVADKDGKVTFTANQNAWRDGLKYINDLYNEKLFDDSIFVQDGTQLTALVAEKVVGVVAGAWQGVFADGENVKFTDYDYLLPLQGPTGLRQTGTNAVGEMNSIAYKDVITTSCKNPELAAQWLDYWLSDEGTKILIYGFENVNFTFSNEKAINGITPSYNRFPENNDNINTKWGNKSVPEHYTFDNYYASTAEPGSSSVLLYEAGKAYMQYEVNNGFPLVSWVTDADKLAEYNELRKAITDYVKQAASEFVIGSRNVNDDAAWKAYCDELNTLGVDRYIQLTEEVKFGK